jgi:hypothetical protein
MNDKCAGAPGDEAAENAAYEALDDLNRRILDQLENCARQRCPREDRLPWHFIDMRRR